MFVFLPHFTFRKHEEDGEHENWDPSCSAAPCQESILSWPDVGHRHSLSELCVGSLAFKVDHYVNWQPVLR